MEVFLSQSKEELFMLAEQQATQMLIVVHILIMLHTLLSFQMLLCLR